MSEKPFKYGVLNRNVLVSELPRSRYGQRTVILGTITKIEGVPSDKIFTVKFLQDDCETWEKNKFLAEKESVVEVADVLWPFLASVSSPQLRVKLAADRQKTDRLMRLGVDSIVGYLLFDDVVLATVKYVGNIKRLGRGFGLQLHQKSPNSVCDGMHGGIRYFQCPPGFAAFTTIEHLVPYNYSCSIEEIPSNTAIANGNPEVVSGRSKNQITTTDIQGKDLALKNVKATCNQNNDFDLNTIIQPDDLRLVKEKREVDLVEVIGGDWLGSSNKPVTYNNLKKSAEKVPKSVFYTNLEENNTGTTRSKSPKLLNHLVNSKTVPRRTKTYTGSGVNCDKKPDNKQINRASYEDKATPPPLYISPLPGTTNDLTVGSLVEISNDVSAEPLYGVIRWMGAETTTQQVLVGVELEDEQIHLPLMLTDGTHNGQRHFKCSKNKGIFVPLKQCHKDLRFSDGTSLIIPNFPDEEETFGNEMECPVVKGSVPPLCMPTEEDVEAVCGKFRGIQGHHNSCYLDATLFAMFTFTSVFDSLLYRPKGLDDIKEYDNVQQVLKDEIVNPLRKNLFVRADRIMHLRKLLDELSSVSGLTTEEKDPEEFLHSLLAQILKAEPFLKLSSGQEAYHYQLFLEKDDDLVLPSVQHLFEQSFLVSNIKLKEVPSCLIVQMPRFGKNYKMFPRIIPSQLLDVTDVIENSPRQCTVCGNLAKWECTQCFGQCGVGLESTAFCLQCLDKAHAHNKRSAHTPVKLNVSPDYLIIAEHCMPPRLYMELFAVICIETSHYVAFVKCGVGHEAPWCFFDSMADRKGGQNGYNIPEMSACPDVSKWLSDEQSCRLLHENAPSDKYLPEFARRLLCDAYICMYQSPDVMMYR